MARVLLAQGVAPRVQRTKGGRMDFTASLFIERSAETPETASGRLHDAARALLFALVAAGVWGFCASAAHFGHALGNVYRVPLVILVSAVATLPAALLAWRALRVSSDLGVPIVAYAKATLHGALTLAAFAPLLAIYSFTTAPGVVSALAVASALVALIVAGASFVRQLVGRVPKERWALVIPVALVCIVIEIAALPQLIAVMSPILPSPTALAGGVEGLLGGAR
jgi:hypothetical protein